MLILCWDIAVQSAMGRHTANFSVSADFHVYGLEWNTTHVTFYVDGAISGSLWVPYLEKFLGIVCLPRCDVPWSYDMPALLVRGCHPRRRTYVCGFVGEWAPFMRGSLACPRYSPCLQQAIGMDFDRETVSVLICMYITRGLWPVAGIKSYLSLWYIRTVPDAGCPCVVLVHHTVSPPRTSHEQARSPWPTPHSPFVSLRRRAGGAFELFNYNL